MNYLIINNIKYQGFKTERDKISVLNHIEMVKKGLKDYVKLYYPNGQEVKLGKMYLENADIVIEYVIYNR
jgi:hypothetical protein